MFSRHDTSSMYWWQNLIVNVYMMRVMTCFCMKIHGIFANCSTKIHQLVTWQKLSKRLFFKLVYLFLWSSLHIGLNEIDIFLMKLATYMLFKVTFSNMMKEFGYSECINVSLLQPILIEHKSLQNITNRVWSLLLALVTANRLSLLLSKKKYQDR